MRWCVPGPCGAEVLFLGVVKPLALVRLCLLRARAAFLRSFLGSEYARPLSRSPRGGLGRKAVHLCFASTVTSAEPRGLHSSRRGTSLHICWPEYRVQSARNAEYSVVAAMAPHPSSCLISKASQAGQASDAAAGRPAWPSSAALGPRISASPSRCSGAARTLRPAPPPPPTHAADTPLPCDFGPQAAVLPGLRSA